MQGSAAGTSILESLSYDSHDQTSRSIKGSDSFPMSPCASMITSVKSYETVPLSPAYSVGTVGTIESCHSEENLDEILMMPTNTSVEKRQGKSLPTQSILPMRLTGNEAPTMLGQNLIKRRTDFQHVFGSVCGAITDVFVDADGIRTSFEAAARERHADAIATISKTANSDSAQKQPSKQVFSQTMSGRSSIFVSPPSYQTNRGDGIGLGQLKTLGFPVV